jgi:hypothetical protein
VRGGRGEAEAGRELGGFHEKLTRASETVNVGENVLILGKWAELTSGLVTTHNYLLQPYLIAVEASSSPVEISKSDRAGILSVWLIANSVPISEPFAVCASISP